MKGKLTIERDCPQTPSCGIVVTSFLGLAVGKLRSLDLSTEAIEPNDRLDRKWHKSNGTKIFWKLS